ncbi:hypothetical protein RBE51_21280 [Pseudomonas taiwanensis]|uniref:hypothetical protein n=1 Tax=Pseudomonas taiwanensis TaxID=470150 RepID=UPI0028DF4D2C|nr:hypothetical protein [Pseudomonas taiwanensis]MDT8925331.1 hypothetical protein [Pseudomonas taiwanensis]
MSHKPHSAIVTHERVMNAFSSLIHLCSSEGSTIEQAIRLTHNIGALLAPARSKGFDGVVKQATQQAQRLYLEAALSGAFVFSPEEWSDLQENFAMHLPVPDHNALRFYISGTPRSLMTALHTYMNSANVFEHYTLKQDAYGICRDIAAQGKGHGQPALELIRFLADVSKSSPQVFPPENVAYAIAAYYGGLKEKLDFETNHNLGLVLNEFIRAVERTNTSFDLPRVEEAIALHEHGYPDAAQTILLKCFPKTNTMKHTALLELEKRVGLDLTPLVERIKHTPFTHDDHVQHTGLLVMHFLSSKAPLVQFDDLHLTTSKVSNAIIGWMETALVDYKDTVSEDNLKTTLGFVLEHRPQWLATIKKVPALREFMKRIEHYAEDILGEDLGL